MMRRGYGQEPEPAVSWSQKVPCGPSQFLYVPAAKAECRDPSAGAPCGMLSDAGEYLHAEDLACVSGCPSGYVPVLRRSTIHEGGELRACLRPEVLAQMRQQQPGGARRMLTDVEVAGIGVVATLAVGVLGFVVLG